MDFTSDTPHPITATEAARGFSDLLHRVHYLQESFVVTKGNKPMAYVFPATPNSSSLSLHGLAARMKRKVPKNPTYDDALAALRRLPPQMRVRD